MADEVTYKDDIVLQLRRAAVWSMFDGQRHMLETAADEIERLRFTDADREAAHVAIDLLNGVEDLSAVANSRACAAAATLRGLLERTR